MLRCPSPHAFAVAHLRAYTIVFALLVFAPLALAEDWQPRVRTCVQNKDLPAAISIVEQRLQAAPEDVEARGWHGRLLTWIFFPASPTSLFGANTSTKRLPFSLMRKGSPPIALTSCFVKVACFVRCIATAKRKVNSSTRSPLNPETPRLNRAWSHSVPNLATNCASAPITICTTTPVPHTRRGSASCRNGIRAGPRAFPRLPTSV